MAPMSDRRSRTAWMMLDLDRTYIRNIEGSGSTGSSMEDRWMNYLYHRDSLRKAKAFDEESQFPSRIFAITHLTNYSNSLLLTKIQDSRLFKQLYFSIFLNALLLKGPMVEHFQKPSELFVNSKIQWNIDIWRRENDKMHISFRLWTIHFLSISQNYTSDWSSRPRRSARIIQKDNHRSLVYMLIDGLKCVFTESAEFQKSHLNGDCPNVLPEFQNTEQSLNLDDSY
jgi:hypothetical protein